MVQLLCRHGLLLLLQRFMGVIKYIRVNKVWILGNLHLSDRFEVRRFVQHRFERAVAVDHLRIC